MTIAALIGGVAALWLFTPLGDAIDAERVRAMVAELRSSPVGLGGVVVSFWIAAALGVPVTLLIATMAMAFGATTSVVLSAIGVAGAAALGFGLGRWLSGKPLEERLGGRIEGISARIVDRGVLALALLRNVPIAPFALVNVACGATRLGWTAFLAGTLLGMGPGIVLAGFFGDELGRWLAEPSLAGALRIALVLGSMGAIAVVADRLLRRSTASGSARHPG